MENKIEVYGKAEKKLIDLATRVANESLILMKQPLGLEIAIEFVSENKIKNINLNFRNIDKVTDVLSFPATDLKAGEILNLKKPELNLIKTEDGFIHFGDIAICIKRLREQAREFGNSASEELKKLVIHSTLHLMGYDHIKDQDYVLMKEKEEFLTDKIKI